ncbi:Neuroligin-2 [Dactylellina cionopaga]|nr:Neuroligin-2 [Dactylellina cionopaga]
MKSYVSLISAAHLLSQVIGTIAVPVLSGQNAPLTILKEVDFWAQYSTRTSSAILIESKKVFSAAQSSCASLTETLWSPEAQDFHAGVNSSLAYQVYLRKFAPTQLFWVTKRTNGGCRAINARGQVQNLGCNSILPTLCTHSGVLSNVTYKDTSAQYQLTVPVRNQLLTGFRDAYGWRFDGVRYATPPQRFQHSTVLDATGATTALEFGASCIQPGYGSEDCLFLNIATPYLPGPRKRNLKPVLFFIHGGSFTVNNGNLGNYDGVPLATRGDVVVVKINYRLGSFGFLAVDGTSITGNYGIGDMITALKWVHANIAALGGDATRITISGDSAGADAVRALMASEAAEGLFSAGVMQSMALGWDDENKLASYITIEEATDHSGEKVLQETSCDTAADPAACLLAVDASIFTSISTVANLPVIDNIILSRDLPIAGGGYIAPVPVIIGTNRDEWAIDLAQRGFTGDQSSVYDYLQFATETYAPSSGGVAIDMTIYANTPEFPTPPGALGAFNVTQRILTDALFKCGSWATAFSGAKHQTLPAIYTYEFNRTYQTMYYTVDACNAPVTTEHPLGDPNQEYFKCHSGELDTSLGFLLYGGEEPRDENDIPYQQLLVDYWAAFAWWHNPNPKEGYLRVRNYWNTLNQVKKTGKWAKVNHLNPTMRKLQWDGGDVPMNEREQCQALGIPYEKFEPST